MRLRIALVAGVLVASAALAYGQGAPARPADPRASALARAMKAELARATTLSLPDAARPYYVAYRVTEVDQVVVNAEFGGTVARQHQRPRLLDVDLRVGDQKFDNSNFLALDMDLLAGTTGRPITVDDDYDVLRRQIWLATDSAYKSAAGMMEKKRAALSGRTEDTEVADFAPEPAGSIVVKEKVESPDPDRLEALARRLAAVLRDYPIYEGGVTVHAFAIRRTFMDSRDGFAYEPQSLVSVAVACRTQADDGMNLMNYDSVVVPTAAALGEPEGLEAMVRAVAVELMSIRQAPTLDSYTGPVLFEGRAAAQLVGALLGRNLSGTPAPQVADSARSFFERMGLDSQLADKLGKPVLPRSFRVEDDPGLRDYKGTPLVGAYRVDLEGVAARKVKLVERGKLVGLLMSQTPRKGLGRSNGHARVSFLGGRAAPGNLIVTATGGLPAARLRARLLARAKKNGDDFAIVIRLLDNSSITASYAGATGGSMNPSRRGPDALPAPLVAVRVTADGKEEYVRGLTLGTVPVRALRDIVATGRDPSVYNFAGGAAALSGLGLGGAGAARAAPSSIVTPALLLEEVELEQRKGPRARPPALPQP